MKSASTFIRLNYPPAVINQPVVSRLMKSFPLEVNIIRAQVSAEEGWLILELRGLSVTIRNAKEWLRGQGLELIENPPLDDGA